MYRIDNSKYENTPEEIYNIGWLSIDSRFNKKTPDKRVVDKLIALRKSLLANQTRGIYPCYFCNDFNEGNYQIQDTRLFFGSAEIWIPNKSFTKTFACPNLIIHYIDKHHYSPPKEFIEAVLDFNIDCSWSGKAAYEEYIKGIR